MANMTLSVPDELHVKMKAHDDIKWSAVAREAFERRLAAIETLERISEKSTMTSEDVREISAKIKKDAGKRFLDEARRRYKHFDSGAAPR